MGEMRENFTFFPTVDSNTHYGSDSLESVFSANRLLKISELVEYYYTPFLCLFGAIGNCLSVAVFYFNASQRNLSSSYYLSALAISDTGFLITVFFMWLESLGVGIITSKFGCPFFMYLSQVTCFLSVYLTVAFTVERFFAVCSPLKRSSVCTVSKAKKVIASLTTLALIAFSYTLVIARVLEMGGGTTNKYSHNDDHLGKLNPDDNGTFSSIPNLPVENEHSFNFTMPVRLNHQQYGKNEILFTPLKFNRTSGEGCQYLKNCQSQPKFPSGFKGYFRENVSDMDEASGSEGGNVLTPPNIGSEEEDRHDVVSFPTTTTVFNSTMLINLHGRDIYDGRNEENIDGAESWVRCSVPMEYVPLSIFANHIDSVVTLMVPFFLIAYFNMRIAICIWKLKDERKNIVVGNRNYNKFNERSIPFQNQQQTSGQPRSGLRKILRFGDSQGHNENELRHIPSNQTLTQRHKEDCQGPDSSLCQLCGCSENSNVDLVEQIPTQRANANHSFTGHYCQQNKVSCPACKSLLSQSQPNAIVNGDEIRANASTLPMSAKSQDNLGRAGGESLLTHCSSSTSKLSPAHGEGGRPLHSNSTLKSLKGLIPNRLHEIGLRMSQRDNAGANLRTTSSTSPSSTSTISSERRVTKMLLLVSTAFLLLNLPSHAVRLLTALQETVWGVDTEVMKKLFAVHQLTNVIFFNTNFAVNFLLYCLSGRNFRKSLWNVLFGRCHKKSRRSQRTCANKTPKKMVRTFPSCPTVQDENNTAQQGDAQRNQLFPIFPKHKSNMDIANDFESIELEITME